MDVVALTLAGYGLWLLWSRWPRRRPTPMPNAASSGPTGGWPSVSIIVPARNEASTLPRLFATLRAVDYPDFEVIAVDDQSDDGTGDVARRLDLPRCTVVTGAPRPEGWRGKQWACHQGASVAAGEVLLFTDADTAHRPDSLRRAVTALRASRHGLLTALPHHGGDTWWERLTGPFHVAMLTVTAPYAPPRRQRAYAIGQYLLFESAHYARIGGHAAVKDRLVEDLPLADASLRHAPTYAIYTDEPLFDVRMYDTLREFVAGWRRNIRAGLGMSSAWAPLEVMAIIGALTAAGFAFGKFGSTVVIMLAVLLTGRAQARLGRFSPWGAVAFPFALGLFCLVSTLAVADMARGRPVLWKGRAYP